MPKVSETARSRQAQEALAFLGRLIRTTRVERQMTAEDLAERIGVSRNVLRRVENGESGVSVGTVFEALVILGLPLFDGGPTGMTTRLAEADRRLQLLPKAVRQRTMKVRDDF